MSFEPVRDDNDGRWYLRQWNLCDCNKCLHARSGPLYTAIREGFASVLKLMSEQDSINLLLIDRLSKLEKRLLEPVPERCCVGADSAVDRVLSIGIK